MLTVIFSTGWLHAVLGNGPRDGLALCLVDFSEESATYGDENNPTFGSSEEFWAMNESLTQQFDGDEWRLWQL